MDDPNMHAYGDDAPDDAEIGRQWRENSSLEKWFPITAERLAKLEQWARDCRDQVLYPAAQHDSAIGKAADGLGQALVEFRLGPNVGSNRPWPQQEQR